MTMLRRLWQFQDLQEKKEFTLAHSETTSASKSSAARRQEFMRFARVDLSALTTRDVFNAFNGQGDMEIGDCLPADLAGSDLAKTLGLARRGAAKGSRGGQDQQKDVKKDFAKQVDTLSQCGDQPTAARILNKATKMKALADSLLDEARLVDR
jgi:hypothetical protein